MDDNDDMANIYNIESGSDDTNGDSDEEDNDEFHWIVLGMP